MFSNDNLQSEHDVQYSLSYSFRNNMHGSKNKLNLYTEWMKVWIHQFKVLIYVVQCALYG